MAKRKPVKQLTQDNWDEDDSYQDSSLANPGDNTAPPEVLQKRKIKRAVRRAAVTSTTQKPNAGLKGFTGFDTPKAPSDVSSLFKFGQAAGPQLTSTPGFNFGNTRQTQSSSSTKKTTNEPLLQEKAAQETTKQSVTTATASSVPIKLVPTREKPHVKANDPVLKALPKPPPVAPKIIQSVPSSQLTINANTTLSSLTTVSSSSASYGKRRLTDSQQNKKQLYLDELSRINLGLINFLHAELSTNTSLDLTPTFRDYISRVQKLNAESLSSAALARRGYQFDNDKRISLDFSKHQQSPHLIPSTSLNVKGVAIPHPSATSIPSTSATGMFRFGTSESAELTSPAIVSAVSSSFKRTSPSSKPSVKNSSPAANIMPKFSSYDGLKKGGFNFGHQKTESIPLVVQSRENGSTDQSEAKNITTEKPFPPVSSLQSTQSLIPVKSTASTPAWTQAAAEFKSANMKTSNSNKPVADRPQLPSSTSNGAAFGSVSSLPLASGLGVPKVAPLKPFGSFKFGQTQAQIQPKVESLEPSAISSFKFGKTQPPSLTLPVGHPIVKSATEKNEQKAAGDEPDTPPPVPVDKKAREEGAFYEQRCKLHFQRDQEKGSVKEWVPQGIGTLFVKHLETGGRQLIIRNNDELGTIQLNVRVKDLRNLHALNNKILFLCSTDGGKTISNALIQFKTAEFAQAALKNMKGD